MKMRLLILSYSCLLFCLLSIPAYGQDWKKIATKVELKVDKPEGLDDQPELAGLLQERLVQAVVLNGVETSESRFVWTTHVRYLSATVTPSTPAQYVVEMEVDCHITDLNLHSILQQTSLTVKGVAGSKEKAVRQAISSIQARNALLKKFITKGKEKIISYYIDSYENN